MSETPVLVAEDLARYFDVSRPLLQRLLSGEGRRTLKAVDGVSFEIPKGTTLSLVGESGCGKSTVARLVVGLYRPSRGRVLFEGIELEKARADAETRRRMQMIFQDPYASLNPRRRVGAQIADGLRTAGDTTTAPADLLERVGLPRDFAGRHPHEFSGGQRQRIAIARALAAQPALLIGDEPISALDASAQAQVARLMRDLAVSSGAGLLFISHDLSVVRLIADRIAVMYLGKIVEVGRTAEVWADPRHPYTKALLGAIPAPDGAGVLPEELPGDVPDPADPPSGCRFHPRCPVAMDICREREPAFGPVACWLHEPA
jgi:oligopeptide/dipeptide ABC transporter ATP-binding protein